MKYVILIFIVCVCGLVGYNYKKKLKRKKQIVESIYEYVKFYDSNISVFKNDLFQINNQYIIMQNNKSANNASLILKNNQIFSYNLELIKNELSKTAEFNLFIRYFNEIGSSDYENEKLKNIEMIKVVSGLINKCEVDIKEKGDLAFKIMLAIGAVIAIILW